MKDEGIPLKKYGQPMNLSRTLQILQFRHHTAE